MSMGLLIYNEGFTYLNGPFDIIQFGFELLLVFFQVYDLLIIQIFIQLNCKQGLNEFVLPQANTNVASWLCMQAKENEILP